MYLHNYTKITWCNINNIYVPLSNYNTTAFSEFKSTALFSLQTLDPKLELKKNTVKWKDFLNKQMVPY